MCLGVLYENFNPMLDYYKSLLPPKMTTIEVETSNKKPDKRPDPKRKKKKDGDDEEDK